MPAIELVALTDAQRDAIRALRFVTPSRDHSRAWGFTDDPALVSVLAPGRSEPTAEERAAALNAGRPCGSATLWVRTREPRVTEWEIAFNHPDAVALVCDLAAERGGGVAP
jgi:hypothetical protein